MGDPAPSVLRTDTVLPAHREEDLSAFTRALGAGSETDWAEFYERYHLRLRRYLAVAWHGEPDLLDDLLQETMVRAVRHIRPFDREEALWSWLTVLARSAVADQGRKRTRWGRFLARWRLEAELRNLPAESTRLTQDLPAALARLDDETRGLLEDKYLRGRSVRQLAHHRRLTEKAVEGRLARARRKLATLLRHPLP